MLDIHSISQPYTCLVLFSALRQDSTLVDSYLAFGGFQAERFSSHTTAAVRVREWPGTHTLLSPPLSLLTCTPRHFSLSFRFLNADRSMCGTWLRAPAI